MQAISSALFPYESKTLAIDDHNLKYLDEGKGEETFLCVHGNPTWSFYWRSMVESFSTTHRVIAVDHLGCGRSDKPTVEEFDYSFESHRDNLVKLIDELNLTQITLVAHDWGGAIGLAAAVKRKERIARIVLLNTGAFPPPYMPFRIGLCRIPLLGQLAVQGLNLFARRAVKLAMSRSTLPEAVADGLLAPYDSWSNRVAIYQFVKEIPMEPKHRSYTALEQLEYDLALFERVPKLLVWGMKDWCFRPDCLHRFQKAWPDAEVEKIHDAGHYVIEDARDEVLEAINNFIRRPIPDAESNE